ncbi:sodium/potassium-transporting ATPase subunit beta-1-like [Gigantopelta aegis]|uniref:sodium/potassium-transporting ATPase subunit beta-1-like n=1 Tax=Gigantopelta aegis TaxID=1735272 RepID=UPI001B88E70C|nr:sodium/potassium-transporting ATPase subunit beta-1-like [Gigantopelta aegis]
MATYGRISSGDKANIVEEDGCATDEWGVRYQGHSRPDGGGLFGKGFGLKSKCEQLRRWRCIIVTLLAVCALLLMIVIIVVTRTSANHTDGHSHIRPFFKKWSNSTDGLYFMPRGRDGTVLIEFNVNQYSGEGYGQYMEFLDYHLHDYHAMNQQDKVYHVCNKTDAPEDKVCMFDLTLLNDCDHFHEYGYTSGTPCVLFFLNPPRHHSPKPFPKDSEVGKMLGDRWSPDHIGLNCVPVSDEDKKHIGNQTIHGAPIQYFPPKGFPTYYYRNSTISKFLVPIVMVRFNTIATSAYVHINCTAWATNFKNSEYYSKTFGFYIK